MNKIVAKLVLSIAALVVSFALVITFSYAWLTMSGAPEVDGIKVNIGGGNTIMVAPDIYVENDDGSVSHYPGTFSQSLDVSKYDSYAYLNNLAGLTPVSTADGINWVRPAYYGEDSEEVQSGQAMLGQIMNIEDFAVDSTLEYANLSADELTGSTVGNYIYLDFWVVSPGEDYDLRVSTGAADEDSGSFVISRMEAFEDENSDNGYSFAMVNEATSAAVRVGFLVSRDWATYSDNMKYTKSDMYDSRYAVLRGQYIDKSVNGGIQTNSDFTIYEPNGNLHLSTDMTGGYYRITDPIGVVDGINQPVSVSDRLTVQLTSNWKKSVAGDSFLIEQIFATSIAGRNLRDKTPEILTESFYSEYLQNVLTPYVNRGNFIKNTADLYASANKKGYVFSDIPAINAVAGATDDVIITTLEKNVPQRIRMFIWLEGQDEDCINFGEISSFIVNLELAGSNNR